MRMDSDFWNNIMDVASLLVPIIACIWGISLASRKGRRVIGWCILCLFIPPAILVLLSLPSLKKPEKRLDPQKDEKQHHPTDTNVTAVPAMPTEKKSDEMDCPYCWKPIKREATVCKYCNKAISQVIS